MNLNRYTIKTRLYWGFGIVLSLLLITTVTGIYRMATINETSERIVEINLGKIDLLTDMSDSVHIVSRVVRSMALLQDKAESQRESIKVANARDQYDRAFTKLKSMPLDANGRRFVSELEQLQARVRPMNNRFLELSSTGDPEAIHYLLKTANPATTQWQDKIHEFAELQRKKSNDDLANARQAYEAARLTMLGLAVFATIGGILLALQITRSVTLPLDQAVALARKVAAGDLSASIEVRENDRTETGALLRALGEMISGLNTIVLQVRQGARALSTGAAEIAKGNLDLSARTEQQASALEETAASMEELTVTVKNNADNSSQASAMALNSAQSAARGGEAVMQVVDVMAQIEASSVRIAEIIGVIDGIAFQTNILALNAAVEAARAGEQGRGFAVVASEVRTLAQRSATAAREIKDLIDDSAAKITDGGNLARNAGSAVKEVVSSIDSVSGIVAEIAEASREQACGIDQTHHAVSEMDQITQHNSALVEEVAATASSLEEQANVLDEVVRRFRLKGEYTATSIAVKARETIRQLPMAKSA